VLRSFDSKSYDEMAGKFRTSMNEGQKMSGHTTPSLDMSPTSTVYEVASEVSYFIILACSYDDDVMIIESEMAYR
jgi:hypothetical protein